MTTSNLIPVLTPQGHLVLAPTDDVRVTLRGHLRDRLQSAFERGTGHGLLELGIAKLVRLYRRISHIGEILQAAMKRHYVRPQAVGAQEIE